MAGFTGCRSTRSTNQHPLPGFSIVKRPAVHPIATLSPATSSTIAKQNLQETPGIGTVALAGGPESSTSTTRLASFQDGQMPAPDRVSEPVNSATKNESIANKINSINSNSDGRRSINSPSDPEINQPSAELAIGARETVELEHVLTSVADCYPLIQVAIGELEAADGKILASWGQFDSVLSAYSVSQPLGFYQTYQNGLALNRPLMGGGEVYGGYRIGDGDFEPWYGERETNEGGELKAGFALPLLKDRTIDARRANLWSTRFQRDELESNVQSRLLQFQRFATQAYWEWVAAGRVVEIQKSILELAETRVLQIKKRLEAGDLPQIAQLDNDRFIAKRKSELIKAERNFQQSGIKLSLFLRDVNCRPIIAGVERLPSQFPGVQSLASEMVESGIAQAIFIRPELAELEAQRQQTCIDLSYAENLTLPKLDVKGFTGQDLGAAASAKGDKTPFELQVGLYAEVPVQRREGLGKIRAAEAKISQLSAKRQFLAEKITVEVQDAASAVNAAVRNIEQTTLNVELNQKSLVLARKSFEAGDIDLVELNLYETSVADAGLQLIAAELEYFSYRAVYETAISTGL